MTTTKKCICPPEAHLIYKYMPDATLAERVKVRERLYDFMGV